MRSIHCCFGLIGLAMLGLAGCQQRVNIDKSFAMDTGDLKAAALIDAPKSEQKIKVEFASTESPVNIHVVLGKNEVAVMDELTKASPMIEIVAKVEKTKSGTLDATIPAGKDYGVYISGVSKKTQVTLKIKT